MDHRAALCTSKAQCASWHTRDLFFGGVEKLKVEEYLGSQSTDTGELDSIRAVGSLGKDLFTSRVSSQGIRIGPVCLSVCPSDC